GPQAPPQVGIPHEAAGPLGIVSVPAAVGEEPHRVLVWKEKAHGRLPGQQEVGDGEPGGDPRDPELAGFGHVQPGNAARLRVVAPEDRETDPRPARIAVDSARPAPGADDRGTREGCLWASSSD